MTYHRKKRMLFFGELPPATIHGASISNSINLKMLAEEFQIIKINEVYSIKNHSSGHLKKLFLFIRSYLIFIDSLVKRKYDIFYGVIYLSTFGILKNIFIVLLFKAINPKANVLLHFHRSDFLVFTRKKINKILFNILDKFVQRYILLSKSQITDFNNMDLSKFYVLSNTIDTEFDIKDLNKNITPNTDTVNLIYIGNYIREKGLIELIKAVQLLNKTSKNKFKLQMHGIFACQKLKLEVIQLLMNDQQITLDGPIYDKDKINKIYNSNLLILPSYNEGLPLILLESMSIGIPVIITPVGYVIDALGIDYPLYCSPKSSISIVDAINKYLAIKNKSELEKFMFTKYKNYSQKSHRLNLLKIFNFEN